MYPPVFQYAYASATVKTLLGTTPCRFYPFGDAPQEVAYPYAVFQTIGGLPENYINQVPDIDSFTTQVDCYALTAADARSVAQALRNALEPYGHIVRWGGDERDYETQAYRVGFDIDMFVKR